MKASGSQHHRGWPSSTASLQVKRGGLGFVLSSRGPRELSPQGWSFLQHLQTRVGPARLPRVSPGAVAQRVGQTRKHINTDNNAHTSRLVPRSCSGQTCMMPPSRGFVSHGVGPKPRGARMRGVSRKIALRSVSLRCWARFGVPKPRLQLNGKKAATANLIVAPGSHRWRQRTTPSAERCLTPFP